MKRIHQINRLDYISIKHIVYRGYAIILVGFIVSILIMLYSLYNYNKVKMDESRLHSAHDSMLELKENSGRLLTSFRLSEDIALWLNSIQKFDKSFSRIKDNPIVKNSEHSEEMQRLWNASIVEISKIKNLLRNPLFDRDKTDGKPVLQRLGEVFRENEKGDEYIVLNEFTRAVVLLTQYENFIMEDFMDVVDYYHKEESVRLHYLEVFSVIIPLVIILASIGLAMYFSMLVSNLELAMLTARNDLEDSYVELNYMFNTTMESIVVVQDWICIDCNKEFLNMFGFRSKGEAISSNIIDLFVEGVHQDAVRSGIESEKTDPYEVKALRRNKQEFHVLIRCHQFQSGNRRATIIAMLDLTQIKKMEQELWRLNENLRKEVARQVEELREKDKIMLQQSRHAALGEMLGNIAHQWRQPLNTLTLNIQDVVDAFEHGELDHKYMQDISSVSVELINYLSNTIDDFRKFYAPSEKLTNCNIVAIISDIEKLIHTQLHNDGIEFVIEGEDIEQQVYENQLKQVLMSIISNSREAILSLKDGDPHYKGYIHVHCSKENDNIFIRVYDNGGGTPSELIDRIFDPYFTTKFQTQGTGTGLFMAKTIVEKNMLGQLHGENTADGFLISIILPGV